MIIVVVATNCPAKIQEFKDKIGSKEFAKACKKGQQLKPKSCDKTYVEKEILPRCEACAKAGEKWIEDDVCVLPIALGVSCKDITCEALAKSYETVQDGCCKDSRMLESCPPKMGEIKKVVGKAFESVCTGMFAVLQEKNLCNDAFIAEQRAICSKCGEHHFANETCIFAWVMDASCDALTCPFLVDGFEQLYGGCCDANAALLI